MLRAPLIAALLLRMSVALWARGQFPAVADGFYFDTLARRMAEGHGYTWGWADGTVTSVAHYPVGYPAFLALVYALLGHSVGAVGLVQALIGTAGVLGFARAAHVSFGARAGRACAWLLALHPALWLYTPALMSEGVAVALLGICVGLFTSARRSGATFVLLGILLGCATLLRPQFLVFVPLFGAALGVSWRERLARAAVLTMLALATCAPWTLRNCHEMQSCALVSVNGGWNLAIGAQTENGAWQAIAVPESCAGVWDEALKDACFGRDARREILAHPGAWLSKVPAKVATTLDYAGAAPWYLHASNPDVFGTRAKWWSGALETLYTRLLLAGALLGVAQRALRRHKRGSLGSVSWMAAGGVALAGAAVPHAVFAYGAVALSQVRRARAPVELVFGGLCFLTVLTHAVFFGAGRYGLVLLPGLVFAAARTWVDCVRVRD